MRTRLEMIAGFQPRTPQGAKAVEEDPALRHDRWSAPLLTPDTWHLTPALRAGNSRGATVETFRRNVSGDAPPGALHLGRGCPTLPFQALLTCHSSLFLWKAASWQECNALDSQVKWRSNSASCCRGSSVVVSSYADRGGGLSGST
jgi:hypothetical protein